MTRCPKRKPTDENTLIACVKAYKAGTFTSIMDAATAFDLKYNQVRNRIKGIGPKIKAHLGQQHLTEHEESAIVKWILQLDKWGFPPRTKYVKDMATNFVRSHGVRNPNLGKNWTTRFLLRHPELESKFAIRLDKQRSFANNPTIIKDFFKKLNEIICLHRILPEDIYNMGEKGFLMGRSTSIKVICKRGKKRNFRVQDGQRELITVIETVSAGGSLIPPSIVYKGAAQYMGWHALVKAGDKAYFSFSSTGWSNREIGLGYLEHNFEPNTAPQAAGRKRLLILDGHTSHMTWEFFDFCLNHDIIPLCLPPHSTHLLQPLDVGLFGPLQRNYSSFLDDWLESQGTGIHKGTFYPLLVKAREMTYTSKNILSAFEATGISPFNPRRVLNTLEAVLSAAKEKTTVRMGEDETANPGKPAPPRTPKHGKSIVSHTQKTLALFNRVLNPLIEESWFKS